MFALALMFILLLPCIHIHPLSYEPLQSKLQTSGSFTLKYFSVLSPKNKNILLHDHNTDITFTKPIQKVLPVVQIKSLMALKKIEMQSKALIQFILIFF